MIGSPGSEEVIMLGQAPAFSGFSVDDVDAAAAFYRDVLGLHVDVENGMLTLRLGTGASVLVYPKGPDHTPATYTVLNFPVRDVAATVAALTERGVTFERYPAMAAVTDEAGVVRGPSGPAIAWFTDPAGNVLSVLEDASVPA